MVEDLGNEAVIRLELGTHAAVFCNWRHMADDMAIHRTWLDIAMLYHEAAV